MRWLALHEALHSHCSCEGERNYIQRMQTDYFTSGAPELSFA